MKRYISKFMPAAFACCFAFGSLLAETGSDQSTKKTHHPVPPAMHPSAGDDSLTFFVGANYTYWMPYEGGLLIATTSGTATAEGASIYPSTTGRSGFQVGVAANTHFDSWIVGVNYTWFYNNPSMSTFNGTAAGTYSTLWDNAPSIAVTSFDGVNSQFTNQFNKIDISLDRGFFAGHYLAFRPWMGLLVAWEDQHLNFELTDGNSTTVADNGTFRNKQSWVGVGPWGGIESTYFFTNDLGLFLSSGVGILLAEHTVTQTQYESYTNATTHVLASDVKTTVDNVEPMIQAMLGLSWDSYWQEWALKLMIAWEIQTYFSHNAMGPNGSNLGTMGDYSMQGLTVGVRANF